MRKLLLLFFLLPISARAQQTVNVSVSNLLRYGLGNEVVGPVSQRRDYVENLTETKISFREFLVGFRLLFDSPPEYGVEFTGIRKRYVEFRKDNLYIRAGDSFSLYGRGLALNLFENRALAHDTGVDGIKMEYHTEYLKLNLTGGNVNYVDVLNLTRREEYQLRAGSVEVTPVRAFSLGLNFVSGKSRFPNTFPDQFAQFNMPEIFGSIRYGDIDFFASYAEKRTTVYGRGEKHTGTAFYSSLSYTGDGFGISFEYKDYRFGIADPYDRFNASRATKALAFQNAPIVHKEHTFTLLTRYPHVVDFNDEVGYQIDIFYTLFGKFTGGVNVAVSSRHYSYSPTGDTIALLPVYGTTARKGSFLPNLNHRYSPFWEVYADLQYYFSDNEIDYVLIGFNRRSDEQADEISLPPPAGPKVDATRTTAFPISGQYSLVAGWIVKLTAERQWVYEGKNSVEPRYSNQLFAVTVSKSPTYSVALRFEFTTDKGTVDGRKNWTAVDVNYRLSSRHTVTFTVGGDRGGQICANGICRFVNPFLGVRATIVSYL